METLVAGAFARRSATLLVLLLLLLAGTYAYVTIAKEANPEMKIPMFMVNVSYPGISPEDSARLLIGPLERELQRLSGLRKITANAAEGYAYLKLEFNPGGDQRRMLMDVRDSVDIARASLPPGAEEPRVTEVDTSQFPVLTITLSGEVAERALLSVARDLKTRIEGLNGVLSVDVVGDRDDLVEILVDPIAIESYRISYAEVAQAVQRNNQLIAAGTLATGAGRIPVSIPGVIKDIDDVLNTAVVVRDGIVVTLGDVAKVRQTFTDPQGFARINGEPSIALEVRKVSGANVIDTVAAVQTLIAAQRDQWPDGLSVNYLQNQAEEISSLLGDLENNVLLAVLLVVLTIVLALGIRASFLVAIAIPGSFLTGILLIYLFGYTINIVVLFALILVVGMLVDGAIVVVEGAQRGIEEGQSDLVAYKIAAQRMAWPVTASTATTLAVFMPLLFWPGTSGQFMRYLPITVLITLSASLVMALVFVPVVGTYLRASKNQSQDKKVPSDNKAKPPSWVSRLVTRYGTALHTCLNRPGLTLAVAVGLLLGMYYCYGILGRGLDFFPDIEPEFAEVQIQTHGNLSIWEADALVREVETRLLDMPDLKVLYTRTFSAASRRGTGMAEDVIGTIRLDLVPWNQRRTVAELTEVIRHRIGDLPGLVVQVRGQDRGLGGGLPVRIEVAGRNTADIIAAIDQVRDQMENLGGFVDMTDDRPAAGVELRVLVDRAEAARFGADVATLGSAVQMLTDGLYMGSYRPDHLDEEVELRLRFPPNARNVNELANLRILTPQGLIPVTNFVTLEAVPLTGLITRVDGRQVQTLSADVGAGYLVAERMGALVQALKKVDLGPNINVKFGGETEDQAETENFLVAAFLLAIFLMFMILVIQFNSIFQSLLVLTAIVFSTAGVLLGLMVKQEPFSLIMSGMGIVALAGIVVNNNIVLIDAYNEYRDQGIDPLQAALQAGVERFRPVMLTAITTVAGLLPMSMGLTIDFIGRDAYFGAPSTQYWIQLASSVIGGLAVATIVTMLFTPSMLVWWDRRKT